MAISPSLLRTIQLGNRVLQWSSAIIVLGIVSYFIDMGPRGQHIIYQEVIAALSAVFFLPGLALGFVKLPLLGRFVLPIDVIFSYLWLTAFIFNAQDYNWHNCAINSPPGGSCRLKKTTESFTFLAFFFTFTSILLDIGFIFPKAQHNAAAHDTANGTTTDKTTGATNGKDQA